MRIFNVDDGIYRGPQPVSPHDWGQLATLGVRAILDLETSGIGIFGEDIFSGQRDSLQIGASTSNMPLGQVLPPDDFNITRAIKFLTTESVSGVYVHCKTGVDRTGMICASYRMREQGWTKESAVAEMKNLGMHPWYYWWAWFL